MDLREILGYNIIMADLRVLIVAANPLARSGLAVLVAGMTGMKIVGATGVAEAASLAGQLLPDTVLLDAGDGEAEDLDAIARLATAQPGLPIVALASEHGAVSQALTFGASALLPAAVDGETLAAALRASARGLVSIARADLSALLPQRGLTNRQIARQLRISEHTVKFHAGAVLGKLNARSRAEAVARAIGLGWILV